MLDGFIKVKCFASGHISTSVFNFNVDLFESIRIDDISSYGPLTDNSNSSILLKNGYMYLCCVPYEYLEKLVHDINFKNKFNKLDEKTID